MRKSPVFIIGAQKAGSTFLYGLLEQAPETVAAAVKEPNYYVAPAQFAERFRDLFGPEGEWKRPLDGSVAYLHSDADVAERIAREHGADVPILCVIRDPVERAVSAYLHGVKHGRETRPASVALRPGGISYDAIRQSENESIQAAFARGTLVERFRVEGIADRELDDPFFNWRYVSNSFYARQLEPWRRTFSSVTVVDFEYMRRDPQRTYDLLSAALGLSATVITSDVEANRTALSHRAVARKFARNVLRNPPVSRKSAKLLRGLAAISRLEIDARRIAARIADADWIALAREEFEALRREAIGMQA